MAKDSDFDQIFIIWRDGIKETFPSLKLSQNEAKKFKGNFLKRSSFQFWVAENDECIIGWQSHIPCTNNPLKFRLYAETSIYVSEKFRGSPVAYKLYAQSLEYVRTSTDIMFLFGYISLNNLPALKIAKFFGFEEIGIIPGSEKNEDRIESKYFVVNNLSNNTKC